MNLGSWGQKQQTEAVGKDFHQRNYGGSLLRIMMYFFDNKYFAICWVEVFSNCQAIYRCTATIHLQGQGPLNTTRHASRLFHTLPWYPHYRLIYPTWKIDILHSQQYSSICVPTLLGISLIFTGSSSYYAEMAMYHDIHLRRQDHPCVQHAPSFTGREACGL